MTKKLDIGCGNKKVLGAIGMDNAPLSAVDVVHDLNVTPYPFDDNFFDEIYCNHILEHLPDLLSVMEELCRIAKPGALIKVSVPYWSSQRAFKDPTHVRYFTEHTFDYFDRNYSMNYYIKGSVKIRKIKYELSGNRIIRFLGIFLPISIFKLFNNTIANIYFDLEVNK